MHPIPPYGVAIQEAIASGDLSRMKDICRQAEEHLNKAEDVSAALQVLKVEIAKLERR
ncbi:DUF1843 domain-containing protein [Methylogaea oryzae]|uniref:DUF1843 domain-containing protein n=1 Tax=Methylogaea oryzae TaxID=1295382 RepID=A0A8D4VPM5_9GAMM|nr:DUF1843 domain-containing protein [Methylogaea oryzae]BBL71049.1 hypothetical protein MoryE10_16550 [Methylogaea oryzae]